MLCCGDLCSTFIVDRLGAGFSGPIHIVFGNNDGDRFRITVRAQAHPHIHLYGELARLDRGGLRVAVVHYDDIGEELAASMPAAKLEIIANCGHMPEVECPEPTLAAIRTFLASPL